MERLHRRGPRSYKVQAVEKWLLHNLDCTVEGVPIHVLMKNRESLHNIPSKKIVNWMTYKPALSQAGFMKTCERILSEHDFIRHESATFDTKYLLEEMRKLQRIQEELEHDELSGMDIVRCERCLRLESLIAALQSENARGSKSATEDAIFKHAHSFFVNNYTYETNARLRRSTLMLQLNHSLRKAQLPELNKLNETWRKLMACPSLQHAQRAGYRPLRLIYTPKSSIKRDDEDILQTLEKKCGESVSE